MNNEKTGQSNGVTPGDQNVASYQERNSDTDASTQDARKSIIVEFGRVGWGVSAGADVSAVHLGWVSLAWFRGSAVVTIRLVPGLYQSLAKLRDAVKAARDELRGKQ